MVLMNGSKMARNAASIINSNQGGGPNKQGLVSSIGRPSSVFTPFLLRKTGWCCLSQNKLLKPVHVSYKGTVGMIYPTR